LNTKRKKIKTNDTGNPGHGVGQTLKCSRIKQDQKDPNPLLIIACRTQDGRNGWSKKEKA
jgi:galactose mutarotase-like enzyme